MRDASRRSPSVRGPEKHIIIVKNVPTLSMRNTTMVLRPADSPQETDQGPAWYTHSPKGNPVTGGGVYRSQEVEMMQAVHEGQCGVCGHFGEHHKSDVLVSILTTKKADESFVDECGHPRHANLHLKVTPISGCDGFIPAAQA
jgi:hypothetical protein